MAIRKLSNKEQIKFLELGLKSYIESNYMFGLCFHITNLVDFPTDDVYSIGRYIKGFNITNAKRLSTKCNFAKPVGESKSYWWLRYTFDQHVPRIKFIKALIKELEENN